jgi:hypothetical protein
MSEALQMKAIIAKLIIHGTDSDHKKIGELIDAVDKMRYCQISYFKTRNHHELHSAKKYELTVDKMLELLAYQAANL